MPLVKMLHLIREDDWQEEIQIGSKLTEIYSDDFATLYTV